MLKVLFLRYLYPLFTDGEGEGNPGPVPPTDNPVPSADEVLDIQKNYVKKTDYDKIKEDYRKLVGSILDGDGELPPNPNEEEAPDIAKLKKELYDPNNSLTNLEYAEKTLKLRDAIIKETGKDPFLPAGIKGDPFESDSEKQAAEQSAQKVAKVLAEAVKEADGDPETFDLILSKIIV